MTILYQDSHLVAVDKPSGLSSIPERDRKADSVRRILESDLKQKLLVVHRLDKEASGVILFAKTAEAHRCLNLQFDRREVAKTYLALVHGRVEQDSGTIETPLRQFGSGRMGIDAVRGKPSKTDFRVKQRFRAGSAPEGGGRNASPIDRESTLLEVRPHTGRRHQIRVHLYSIGHPIVGDTRYGDPKLREGFPRLMLHACRIEFALPTGEKRRIESPAPEEFTLFAAT